MSVQVVKYQDHREKVNSKGVGVVCPCGTVRALAKGHTGRLMVDIDKIAQERNRYSQSQRRKTNQNQKNKTHIHVCTTYYRVHLYIHTYVYIDGIKYFPKANYKHIKNVL